MTTYDALVLAGGSARRLGGRDKPSLQVGGRSLLDRVLAATSGARRTIVVGPERSTARPVLWTVEQPTGGGPVAAMAAGLELVTAERVALLAADLPFLDETVVLALLEVTGDGALLVDASGRDQLLVGVWRTAALRAALPAVVDGARLGPVLGGLAPVRVPVPDVAGKPAPWTDCDTDEDLRRAREIA